MHTIYVTVCQRLIGQYMYMYMYILHMHFTSGYMELCFNHRLVSSMLYYYMYSIYIIIHVHVIVCTVYVHVRTCTCDCLQCTYMYDCIIMYSNPLPIEHLYVVGYLLVIDIIINSIFYQSTPLLLLEPDKGYLFSVSWSPSRPLVMALGTAQGQLLMYDFQVSTLLLTCTCTRTYTCTAMIVYSYLYICVHSHVYSVHVVICMYMYMYDFQVSTSCTGTVLVHMHVHSHVHVRVVLLLMWLNTSQELEFSDL